MSPALFGAPTKAIVSGVGRDLTDFPDGHLFSLFVEQVDQPACNMGPNVQALRDLFFIFLQNLSRHEPNEAAPLNLFVKQIATAVLARLEGALKGRNT